MSWRNLFYAYADKNWAYQAGTASIYFILYCEWLTEDIVQK